jgi:hypothetical protein
MAPGFWTAALSAVFGMAAPATFRDRDYGSFHTGPFATADIERWRATGALPLFNAGCSGSQQPD